MLSRLCVCVCYEKDVKLLDNEVFVVLSHMKGVLKLPIRTFDPTEMKVIIPEGLPWPPQMIQAVVTSTNNMGNQPKQTITDFQEYIVNGGELFFISDLF